MNFLGGGERHSSADYRPRRTRTTFAGHTAPPGDLAFLEGRPGDVRGFVHRRIIGGIGGAIGGLITGGPLGALAGGLRGFSATPAINAVPQAATCPPGFVSVGGQCVPRFTAASAQPTTLLARPRILGTGGGVAAQFGGQNGAFDDPTIAQRTARRSMGLAEDPAAGVAVMGRFGAGTEPEIFMTDTRRCPRRSVLGVDGICYNKRDIRRRGSAGDQCCQLGGQEARA